MRISEEDLHWLYWGSIEEEMISKLLNEENELIMFIRILVIKHFCDANITKMLIRFLVYLRDETSESNIIKSHITEKQLDRLWQLDHKYGLLYNYDYERKERIKQQLIQK